MRVGLVGTSQWATKVHGAGAAQHADLVAVWGRDPVKAAACAEELGTAAAASFEELVDSVDTVVLSVPPSVQVPLAVQAAKAGRDLLLEKPLALDVEAGRELVEVASGVRTAVFFTRVWAPRGSQWLDDVRAQGGWESGRMTAVSALSADLLAASPWRAEHGALWDVGPHVLSVLERVLGPVVDLRALRGTRDLVQVVFSHETGATSSAELTLTASPASAQSGTWFWGANGRSAPFPELGLEDVPGAVGAALTALETGESRGLDAAYGLHVTEVLAAVEAQL